MRRGFWLQLIAISVFFTALSATISMLVFQSVSAKALQESRKNAYLFLANIVESAPYAEGLRRYENFRSDSPTIGRSIWIISESGQVYGSNTSEPPPVAWQQIPKPQRRHEISAKTSGFRNFADLILVRLDKPDPIYLLVRPEKDTPNRAIAGAEVTIFLLGLFGTSLAGLTMIFVYLRRTSTEAKKVISQLHAGDLHARFVIRKFDEIGNLKLDFNAMADEIERLVARVQVTESTRRNLLQELSHDLRTPLTSLRTSVETLAQFRDKMTPAQQQEMLGLAQSELNYFVHLLEDLFFIADLAEPSYKKSLESVDMQAMCAAEVHARAVTQPRLRWHIQNKTDGDARIEGDAHLLLRMLRNALDNAAKFASEHVEVVLSGDAQTVQISIEDDGPGIGPDAMQSFGRRRKHRIQSNASQPNLSLGLGSVIISAIAELHGGAVSIANRETSIDAKNGTKLIIELPCHAHAH
jgi:signal transduction histidine kinase